MVVEQPAAGVLASGDKSKTIINNRERRSSQKFCDNPPYTYLLQRFVLYASNRFGCKEIKRSFVTTTVFEAIPSVATCERPKKRGPPPRRRRHNLAASFYFRCSNHSSRALLRNYTGSHSSRQSPSNTNKKKGQQTASFSQLQNTPLSLKPPLWAQHIHMTAYFSCNKGVAARRNNNNPWAPHQSVMVSAS